MTMSPYQPPKGMTMTEPEDDQDRASDAEDDEPESEADESEPGDDGPPELARMI
jgi:hypothetical protein